MSGSATTCPVCGAPASAGDRFCEACGAELVAGGTTTAAAQAVEAVTCRSCGSTAPLADGYCSTCGARAPDPRDHEQLTVAGAAGVSDKGKRHHRNEDAMAVAAEPGVVYAVVCDGVSTTVDPQDASLGAVTAALEVLVAGGASEPALDAAYDAARDAVLAVEFAPAPELGPPSCTFLAAVVTDSVVSIASLGDCRAYWMGDDAAMQLTHDDSWATEQIEAGLLTAEDAYADPKGHMITRWLGRDADPEWRPRGATFAPPSAGRLVLCSDGLWNYTLDPAALVAASGNEPDLLALAESLTTFANDAGGADNITVVVVDIPLPKGD